MKARVLTGSKQEISEKVAEFDGEIREAIVFVEEPCSPGDSVQDIFAEMEPFTVRRPSVDDWRETIYRRMDDE